MIFDRFKIIDLTHSLHEGVPTWSGGCGYRLEIKLDYEQGLRAQTMKGHAGVGTHMDAPSHFIPDSWNIGDIPLENLIVPACVIDVRKERAPDLFIQPRHLEAFEKRHGPIPARSLVIGQTGWEQFWAEPERYRSPDSAGKMHFPGFSAEAADFLIHRKICGIGIDTLSPDGSSGRSFPVHEKILGARMYILENLAHLDQMPPTGAYVIAFPPKAQEATESIARVAALIPR